MSLSPGTATNGFTGAVALKSDDAGGTLRYIPCYDIDPQAYDGKEPVMLVNNTAYAVNVLQGTGFAIITLRCPLIATLMNADFFARLVLSGLGDTGASGYHTMTVWADNLGGDGPKTYARCKLANMSLQTQFSQQAGQQVAFLTLQFYSADPESVAVTALTAPSSGPLSTSGILGFGQAAFSPVSNMVAYSLEVATGLQFIPGTVAGTGIYPVLPVGFKLNTVGGAASIRQIRNPATALKDGSLTATFGSTGAGISFLAELQRTMTGKRQPGGINFVASRYFLNSNDGSSPLAISDM